jgi:excinuclease ABC subunit A
LTQWLSGIAPNDMQIKLVQCAALIAPYRDLSFVRCNNWVIDLGPEGGDKGGEIIAAGTPEQVAKVKESYTGRYLKTMLESQK